MHLYPSSFFGLFSAAVANGGFDRVAAYYDALARLVFGSALRKAQEAALQDLPTGAPHVLILGGGTGWVLCETLRRRPQATVLYLDASAAMLAQAKRQLKQNFPLQQAQVEFRHGTEAALRSTEAFEAIITFFVLDCLTPADFLPALRQLSASARPEAPWLLADFLPAHTWWQGALQFLMYRFFRLTAGLEANKLPDWPSALRQVGWQPSRPASEFYGGAIAGISYKII